MIGFEEFERLTGNNSDECEMTLNLRDGTALRVWNEEEDFMGVTVAYYGSDKDWVDKMLGFDENGGKVVLDSDAVGLHERRSDVISRFSEGDIIGYQIDEL